MPHLLHLDSSADVATSRSRAIGATFARAWEQAGGTRTHLDLHADPLPHLADPALHWAPSLRPAGARPDDTVQRAVLAQLLAADVVVIGVPLYNYSMPSTLKAWVDHIHVPGTTAGDVHPMAGRTALLISSAGALYDAGTPTEFDNHAIPPLRQVLGDALGMQVRVVSVTRTLADALPQLADERERAAAELEVAHAEVARLAGELAAR